MELPLATLQDAFYIIGIIFMGVILILVIALVAAVFVIRAKVASIQRHVQETIDQTVGAATKGGELIAKAGAKAAKAAAGTVKQVTGSSRSGRGRRRSR